MHGSKRSPFYVTPAGHSGSGVQMFLDLVFRFRAAGFWFPGHEGGFVDLAPFAVLRQAVRLQRDADLRAIRPFLPTRHEADRHVPNSAPVHVSGPGREGTAERVEVRFRKMKQPRDLVVYRTYEFLGVWQKRKDLIWRNLRSRSHGLC